MPEIIYENSDFLVINKPSGLVVHSDGKTTEKTLVDWIEENYPEIRGVGEPLVIENKNQEIVIDRPGIVHRLDRETSGLLIIAKNQETFEYFKSAFKNRTIHKTYHTFVFGHVKLDEGTIDAPIARSKSDFRKWSAQRGARGQERPAVTNYNVIKRFDENQEKFTFLEVMPETGRTHQIRVHMKYMNNPIVGDQLYGGKNWKGLHFNRVALHSRKLTFTAPNGEEMTFEAPYPDDFLEVLAKL